MSVFKYCSYYKIAIKGTRYLYPENLNKGSVGKVPIL